MISYHLFKNDGAGGPIDYSTAWATTASLSIATSALALSSDNSFGCRAFDTVSGYEDTNVDARVRIVVGSGGVDVTKAPNAPVGLSAVPRASGTARVTWQYPRLGQPGKPTGFHVYLGTPTVSYTSPVATVAYADGVVSYAATLSGLTDDVVYQVGVRSYNVTVEEANVVVVSVVGDTDSPDPIDDLSGSIS